MKQPSLQQKCADVLQKYFIGYAQLLLLKIYFGKNFLNNFCKLDPFKAKEKVFL